MASVRQQKVAGLIQQALSDIFRKDFSLPAGPALVTISEVQLSPDLSVARIYLSVYKASDAAAYLNEVNQHSQEIRGLLGRRIRNRVRHIPQLLFVLDSTLDNVFRLEELFRQIRKD
ncbi:MAG: 30S ribosome-binding factor RbfA [Chitinophagales bacterium]|nr:30S ribosome-binding factor RbfA [Chitinophagales bacterium]MDW8393299.1 30S ribosome-binding factor RbfA [Chitinophagales bacterium]